MARPRNLKRWEDFYEAPSVVVQPRKLLGPDDTIFTMGSCFAEEVRKALGTEGYVTYPDYRGVPLDRVQEMFDRIPDREMPPHYDTFTMLQEFEAAFGLWPDREEGFWET